MCHSYKPTGTTTYDPIPHPAEPDDACGVLCRHLSKRVYIYILYNILINTFAQTLTHWGLAAPSETPATRLVSSLVYYFIVN